MKKGLLGSVVAVLLMACATTLFAGGPLIIFDETTRTPYAYPPGVISVYTDLGDNGLFTNAQADAQTAAGYAEWTAVPSSYLSAAVVGDFTAAGLPDIDGFNAGSVIGTFNGGGIHVMYDDDQSIVQFFFGAPPGVLGISSPDFSATGTPDLLESWAVINGAAADPLDTGSTYQGVYTHEFGHSINLAHTQCVGAAGFFGDTVGPDFCGIPYPGGIVLDDFETMYPYLDITPGSTGDYQATVDHADDIAALSTIYPTAGFPGTHGTITGIVYDVNGVTELTGINVIARPVADPMKGSVSALSGDFTQGALGPDGLFTLNGLTPGADYVLYIDEIVAGGFSTSPGIIPGDGDEEYWNAAEDADPNIDDPCDYTFITAVAGAPFTADIIVNGDPNNLNLGDDDYVEVALPFPFPFCGAVYNSVFVGSNGYITFGSGDTDFSESISEFLDYEPRIAPLWDDLNPSAGGTITVGMVGSDFVISYKNIPEYFSTGSNSFDITLKPSGMYDVTYGTITASDGLAGRTPGGGQPDPGEVDLTIEPQPIGPLSPTVYEYFGGFDNDLDGEFMAFAGCVFPDEPEIAVDPTALSAVLCEGEMETQVLRISNLGDLDLTFNIATNQDIGGPAHGVIPKLDLTGNGDPGVLDEARIAKMADDNAVSTPKPEVSPLKVDLPHAFALMVLSEDFNSGFPAGWSAIDNDGNGVIWTVPAQGGGNDTGGTGDAAGANSDWVGPAEFDTELWSPPISGYGPNVVLSFTANYQNFAGIDFFDVDVSVDGGSNWTNVMSWNEDHGSFGGPPGEQVALNLDAVVAGYPEFIVRWRYYHPDPGSEWLWWVHLDDVLVVSDETLIPCDFISSVAPDMGTIAGDAWTDVDVTFDATGFAPGFYDCELIVFSNAFNEPRLVVPLHLTVPQKVALDIKPTSCPNPLNVKNQATPGAMTKKGGVLPVAILGSASFDVTTIDPASLTLAGVAPIRHSYEDVAAPYTGDELCECSEGGPDGFMDLTLKFQKSAIIAMLGTVYDGNKISLTIDGLLLDGTVLVGSDCVLIRSHMDDPGGPSPAVDNAALGAAVPNPFNPSTRISYQVPTDGIVELAIYDLRGRLVERLVSGQVSAGVHVIEWNASNLASGVYFYRLTAGDFKQTRKLVLLK